MSWLKSSGNDHYRLDVHNPEALGLPRDAKVLLFNDGKITGRQARLRRLVNGENRDKFADLPGSCLFIAEQEDVSCGSVCRA